MNSQMLNHRIQCATNAKAWELLATLTNTKPPSESCVSVVTDGQFRVTIQVDNMRCLTDKIDLPHTE